MSNKFLLMWLEAPLQSWGVDSKFGRRDTLNFPTKSAVLGLVCCSLGLGGEQRDFLAKMAPLKHSVISYLRMDKHTNRKKEPEPLLRDFHMVGSGYKDECPWEKMLIPKTDKGKKSNTGGVKLTYRYYLQDNYFAVV